jgi:hypothetical protein
MKYLTNTFSPMMLGENTQASIKRIDLAKAVELAASDTVDAISHETTAPIVGVLIGRQVAFNRVNLVLNAGDVVVAVIPKFRATEAREFTADEVMSAGFDCFMVQCHDLLTATTKSSTDAT